MRTAAAPTSPSWPSTAARSPRTLVESELFGHCAARSPARRPRAPGSSSRPTAGRILLDEVGDLPLAAQVKLLRVLQEGEFQRVGADEDAYGGCARARRHERRSRASRCAGEFRRTSTTASTSSRSRCRRCGSAGTMCCCSPTTSCSASRAAAAPSRSACRPTRCGRCASTSGQATCASSSTRLSTRWCSRHRDVIAAADLPFARHSLRDLGDHARPGAATVAARPARGPVTLRAPVARAGRAALRRGQTPAGHDVRRNVHRRVVAAERWQPLRGSAARGPRPVEFPAGS